MHLKKRTAYLLFFIGYVGALLIEKPIYSDDTIMGCFSYLFTVIIHFTLFSLMLYGVSVSGKKMNCGWSFRPGV